MNNIRIFLVDDDLLSLKKYKEYLNNNNFKNVSLFLNQTICLYNLHKNPDIVFFNYRMCDSAGNPTSLDLIKKIKRFNQNINIVIFSTNENIDELNEAFKNGVFDYIGKDDDEIINLQKVIDRILFVSKK